MFPAEPSKGEPDSAPIELNEVVFIPLGLQPGLNVEETSALA
jgi:hypothetical protein